MLNKAGEHKKNILGKKVRICSGFFQFFSASQKGITLLELMVVVAIIGIGSSIAIVSFTPARSQAKLKAAQTELAANIKLAQSYALQGKSFENSAPPPEWITPKFFGVDIQEASKYVIYYCNQDPCEGTPTELETFLLTNGVTLDSSSIGKKIAFNVPDGNLPSSFIELEIALKFTGAPEKTVTIKPGGSIVEN